MYFFNFKLRDLKKRRDDLFVVSIRVNEIKKVKTDRIVIIPKPPPFFFFINDHDHDKLFTK